MTTKPMCQKLLLTCREAAEALAISQRTVFTLTKAGQLAAVRIGRGVRYAMSDIQEFIASQRTHAVESNSENGTEKGEGHDG